MSWIAQTLMGVVWAIGGVGIGLGPPLSETGRGASSPAVGWLAAAAGVWMIVAGFRRAVGPPADRNRRAKHASGRAPDWRTKVGQPLSVVGCALAGFGGIWWGIASGHITIFWFGLLLASFVVAAFPAVVEVFREGTPRR
ncbi:hypothetical protein [Mycobacterium sp. GA-2829]|uniref:hypothetical protein n=1 Tax=Mycobacterium sp. GA-2829 TaxID=1772283 RepID=UPI00073FA8E4|nr:hypothetical protein [Mycobacterium sp. GA-2829]KUI26599.1 hypothetical protein AU194_19580 [Mycobacterium sp. GA-2829]